MSKKSIGTSLIWKFMERCGVQGASFIVQIVLARMLLPEDFGKFTIVLTFVALGQILIDCGFGQALIQKRELRSEDATTAFFISLAFSIVCITIIIASAKSIEVFYKMEGIALPIIIVAITLVICSFNSIQLSLAAREFKFKEIFQANFTAAILSACLGITAAFMHFGIWALIVQYVSNIIVSCLILGLKIKWHPSKSFSKKSAKEMFGFGWKIMIASLTNRLYVEVYNLVIGKYFSAYKLGLYNRGKTFPFAIENTLAAVIESVMLTYFSRIQDDKREFTDSLRFSMRMTAFIVAPIMFGLGAIAEPLTVLLLTNKWIEIVPLIQIFSIGYTFGPISAVNLMAVNGIGRSDIYLKLEVIKRIIGILILIISLKFGFIYVSIGLAVSFFINYLINVIPNIRLLKYGLIQQIRDIIVPIVASFTMFICIVLVNSKLQVGNILLIIIDVILGTMIYTAISYVFNKKSLHWVIQEIKERI